MTDVLSLATVLLLTVAGLLHVYWAFGGRALKQAAVPRIDGRPAFVPSRWGTLAVAAALLLAAAIVAVQGALVDAVPANSATRWACRFMALGFLLRAIGDFRLVGLFKSVRGSSFARWDTRVYSPLILLLAVGCAATGF